MPNLCNFDFVFTLPIRRNHAKISTLGGTNPFLTALVKLFTSIVCSFLAITVLAAELTKNTRLLSNFQIILSWANLFSLTVVNIECISCNRSNSHWNRFLHHWKFHIHCKPSQKPQSLKEQCFRFDNEYSLGNASFSLPLSSQKSSQNFIFSLSPSLSLIPSIIDLYSSQSPKLTLQIFAHIPPLCFTFCLDNILSVFMTLH